MSRRKEYKEDSTKGKAMLNPKTYKGDVLVQAWIDSRQLAMLSVWLDNNDRRTRYMSDIVKFTIEEVVRQLVDAEEVEKIELSSQGRLMLECKYRTQLNPGGRGKTNVLHNLVLDERRLTPIILHIILIRIKSSFI